MMLLFQDPGMTLSIESKMDWYYVMNFILPQFPRRDEPTCLTTTDWSQVNDVTANLIMGM